MKKIAIYSDLHLGIHQNNSNWHKIADEWSDWFIDDLKKQNLDTLFFLGDYFHSRSEISVNTLHFASSMIHKFKDFDIKMLVGNHCSFYKDRPDIHSLSIFKGYSNIEIVDKPKNFEIFGKNVFMAPWGTEIDQINDCDVLMGHFEIESFKMNPSKFCEHGFTATQLLKKTHLIFSGHFHLRDEREYKNGKIVYVGNPFQMDFGDYGDSKGYYVLNFEDLSYDFFENNISPKHKKVKLSELDTNKDAISNNIVKIIVDKKIEDGGYDKYSQNVSNLKPFSFSFDNSMDLDEPKLDEESENIDMSGVDFSKAITDFVDIMNIDNKEDVLNYIMDLYKRI